MKKALKIILLVLLFLAVAAGSVLGYRWFSGRSSIDAPVQTEGQVTMTAPASINTEAEKDDLASDSAIKDTTEWPFADRKSDSKFEAKESVGYTAAQKTNGASAEKTKAASGDKEETTKKSRDKDEETTKKSSGSSSSAKALLEKIRSDASGTKNGHPVKVDSNGINIEYKKFAVADLDGDGKDEVFLYAESTKGQEFYGNSYIVYDDGLKDVRTTMVIDKFEKVSFYKSGVFEITTGKFGFVNDATAAKFGVKNKNSILGYDTTATPYLRYTTNGPYIDAPSEVSASDYKAAVSKLRAGGKVDVTVYDFTEENVAKL